MSALDIVITTERLMLTKASFDDAEFIFELVNDKSFIDNIADKGVRTLEDARQYIQKSLLDSYDKNGYGLYIARLKSTNQAIGLCGLVKRDDLEWADVGYALLPKFTGKGFASEGAKAALDYGYHQLGLVKIVAITNQDNQASIGVLEKIGLKFDKVIQINGGDCALFV